MSKEVAPYTTDPIDRLYTLYEEAAAVQASVRQKIQDILVGLADLSFGSLKAKKEIANRVQELLDLASLRIQCPHCHEPAILRCYPVGNAREGAFQFEHFAPQRTRHGGRSTFPSSLYLVPAPLDRRRAHRRVAKHRNERK